jgi:hypothetical protein
LTSAIGSHYWNAGRGEQVRTAAGLAQGENGGMLDQPELVISVWSPLRTEFTHRMPRASVISAP